MRERDDFRQLAATLEKTVQAEQLASRNAGTEAERLDDRQRAAALLDELVAEQPQSLQHQHTLAATLYSIGLIQTELKQYDEAERSFERALELRDALRKQQPDKTHTALDLAEVRFALGRLYWDTERRPDGHRLWQAALVDFDKVATQSAEDPAIQEHVASSER